MEGSSPFSSVVRVFATTQEWDYDNPWQPDTPESGTGSGVVVGPGRVLTGAHVVANATFLQVQKVQVPDKYVAQVASIWHDCDLALLSVEDPAFMEGMPMAEVSELPELRDRVSVVGYPVGGEEISVTEGVVSRVEIQEYKHSQRDLLAVTIDAPINSGNSGGPVYRDGKVAGIAFQTLSNAENIGEMVPTPIIRRFLEGAKNGIPPGIPGLGIKTQNLENPLLRSRLGLGKGEGGVLVVDVAFGSSCWGQVEPGDALLTIGGLEIANNESVQYRGRFRTRFDVVLGDHAIGEVLPVTVLRKGERKQVELTLQPLKALVPHSQYDAAPSYFIFGGLVFQTLTRNFLTTWNRWWEKAPKEFLHHYYTGIATAERQEVVVLSRVLADEINVGYEDLYSESVRAVNGEVPRDLRHFVELVEAAQGVIEISTTNGLAAFEVAAVPAANERILERYRIRADRRLP